MGEQNFGGESASYVKVKLDWDSWRVDKSHIKTKLHKNYIRKSDWFLTTHAASEAALRRLLLIGLRSKQVPYDVATKWQDNHHVTFGKAKENGTFIKYYDLLFASNWDYTIKSEAGLEELWLLWHDYSKPVRNGLAHGARKYNDDWLDAALSIDRLFMMRLDKAISPIIGGSPFSDLRLLSPRLPRGISTVTAERLLQLKARPPKVEVPLAKADERLTKILSFLT